MISCLPFSPLQAQEEEKSIEVIVIENGEVTSRVSTEAHVEEILEEQLEVLEEQLESAESALSIAGIQLGDRAEECLRSACAERCRKTCDRMTSPVWTGNRAFLGIEFEEVHERRVDGVRVTKVVENSAAEIMGLKVGDIILSINGDDLADGDIGGALSKYQPGDVVELEVKRGMRTKDFKGVLGRRSEPRFSHSFPSTTDAHHYFEFNSKPKLGVNVSDEEGEVLVTGIIKGSAAEEMGLQAGDVITEIGNNKVSSIAELREALQEFELGDEIEVTYRRDGNDEQVKAELKALQNYFLFDDEEEFGHDFDMDFSFDSEPKPMLGVHVSDKEGEVLIQSIISESAAEKMDLQEGDIIEAINGTEVNTIEELIKAIQQLESGDEIQVRYRRDGSTQQGKAELTEVNSSEITRYRYELHRHTDTLKMHELEKHLEKVHELYNSNYNIWTNKDGATKVKVIIIQSSDKSKNEEIVLRSRVDGDDNVMVFESDLELKSLDLFPNPSEGQLTISFDPEENPDVTIRVISIDNKEVYNSNYNDVGGIFNETIELGNNPPGMYILQIESGGKSHFERIVLK